MGGGSDMRPCHTASGAELQYRKDHRREFRLPTKHGGTVNRFCSSGLQAIASASNSIMAGQSGCIVAGGVENMSKLQMLRLAPMPEDKAYS